ncbi:MAG: sugar ABC transporter ATP-binding protein [Chloroflexi bacterium]|nr:sugar ABC transporter ATP-binding protein [Chloroflexota bacterium]
MRGVNLSIQFHSVHGLVGANGAGKSTLIKILSGALQATSGQMMWKGNACQWHQPADARAAGVATMYQHIPLVPTLPVLDNVLLGHRNWLRLEGQLMEEFEQLLARVGYEIDARSLVGDLSIGQRQMVALLQAVARGADLVIMDEPTASLTQSEREVVFNTIRRLSQVEGTSFLYVSHFLEEVLDLTDTVTVLRDGQVVASAATSDWSESQLVEAMVGKKLLNIEREKSAGISAAAPIALEVSNLQSPDKIAGISFAIHQGEILGLAGFLGSGRSELLQAIFGADSRASGSVRVFGKEVPHTPAAAVRAGIALVPEDRGKQGLIRDWEIWRNISLPNLSMLSLFKILPQQEAEAARAEKACEALHIVAPSIDTEVSALSGGNAQKVVFAKWLYGNASVFLLDEPTSGVDIGAKADILELIRNFAREGKAVIVVSSEFEELLAVATRIMVMSKGRIVAERRVTDTSEDELVMLASGLG